MGSKGGSGTRGGKLEQYAGAGRQITKNDAKKQSV